MSCVNHHYDVPKLRLTCMVNMENSYNLGVGEVEMETNKTNEWGIYQVQGNLQ